MCFINYHFESAPTWEWLCTVMDSTEAQLRFGSALNNLTTQPTHSYSSGAHSSSAGATSTTNSLSGGNVGSRTSGFSRYVK